MGLYCLEKAMDKELAAFYNDAGTVTINKRAAGIDDLSDDVMTMTPDKAALLASHLMAAAKDARESLDFAIFEAERAKKAIR